MKTKTRVLNMAKTKPSLKPKGVIDQTVINHMLNMQPYPFVDMVDVYYYLKGVNVINFSISFFYKVMSEAGRLIENASIEDEKEKRPQPSRNNDLSEIQILFAQLVHELMQTSVKLARVQAYRGAMQDKTGRTALAYLGMYDLPLQKKQAELKKGELINIPSTITVNIVSPSDAKGD